jgi:hypothetical protein
MCGAGAVGTVHPRHGRSCTRSTSIRNHAHQMVVSLVAVRTGSQTGFNDGACGANNAEPCARVVRVCVCVCVKVRFNKLNQNVVDSTGDSTGIKSQIPLTQRTQSPVSPAGFPLQVVTYVLRVPDRVDLEITRLGSAKSPLLSPCHAAPASQVVKAAPPPPPASSGLWGGWGLGCPSPAPG